MTRFEGARRMITLIAVVAAVLAQDIVIGRAGANHLTSAPALLSAELLLDAVPSSTEATASAVSSYGLRLSPLELTAPVAPTPPTKTVPNRLTWLNLSEAKPGAGDSIFRWPVNRDSAGAPIVLNSDFTGSLIKVRF